MCLPGPRHDGKYWICTDCATILAIHLSPSLSIKIASFLDCCWVEVVVFCKRPTIKVFFQLDFFLFDTIGHPSTSSKLVRAGKLRLQVPFLKLHSSGWKVDVFAFHASDSHRSLGWIFEEPTRKLLMPPPRFPALLGSIVMRARFRSFSSSIPTSTFHHFQYENSIRSPSFHMNYWIKQGRSSGWNRIPMNLMNMKAFGFRKNLALHWWSFWLSSIERFLWNI